MAELDRLKAENAVLRKKLEDERALAETLEHYNEGTKAELDRMTEAVAALHADPYTEQLARAETRAEILDVKCAELQREVKRLRLKLSMVQNPAAVSTQQGGEGVYSYTIESFDTGLDPEDQWKKCSEELAEVLFEIRLASKASDKDAIEHRRALAVECADLRVALANLERVCEITPQEARVAEGCVRSKLESRGCYPGKMHRCQEWFWTAKRAIPVQEIGEMV